MSSRIEVVVGGWPWRRHYAWLPVKIDRWIWFKYWWDRCDGFVCERRHYTIRIHRP